MLLYGAIALASLCLLHRVACALEDRGLIYYRRGRGRAALGAALGAAEEHLRPQAQQVRQVHAAEPTRDDDARPDPPKPAEVPLTASRAAPHSPARS